VSAYVAVCLALFASLAVELVGLTVVGLVRRFADVSE
jgi:hypothetical protein